MNICFGKIWKFRVRSVAYEGEEEGRIPSGTFYILLQFLILVSNSGGVDAGFPCHFTHKPHYYTEYEEQDKYLAILQCEKSLNCPIPRTVPRQKPLGWSIYHEKKSCECLMYLLASACWLHPPTLPLWIKWQRGSPYSLPVIAFHLYFKRKLLSFLRYARIFIGYIMRTYPNVTILLL